MPNPCHPAHLCHPERGVAESKDPTNGVHRPMGSFGVPKAQALLHCVALRMTGGVNQNDRGRKNDRGISLLCYKYYGEGALMQLTFY
jgi:hypothetical protein